MARPAFKRWFTKLVPESAERNTHVLLSSLALIAMFAWRQPLGGAVWNVTDFPEDVTGANESATVRSSLGH